ncbi:hypothetical protein AgCh_018627 [Apium graveolens]
MLLRSTSTPVAPSFFSNVRNREVTKTPQAHCNHFTNKDSNFNIPFGSSQPVSYNPKLHCLKALKRAHSDSNLEGLAPNFCLEEFHQCVDIHTNPMLRSEPSLSLYNSEDGFGEEKEEEKIVENDGLLTLEKCVKVTNGDYIGSGEFSFGKKDMSLIEEEKDEKEQVDQDEGVFYGIEKLKIEENDGLLSTPLYLSTGFGMDDNGVGSACCLGVDFKKSCFDQGVDVEDFYKRLVSEDPSNPLFLRNYAQLLQSKGDLSEAEDLFFRATLADPKDGEILLQYAKLVWELHHDQDRALSYFERAACAAPNDSHVLAAYACFLWEMDDGRYEDIASTNDIQIEDKINPVELPNSSQEKPVIPPFKVAAGLEKDDDKPGVQVGDTVYTSKPPGEGVDMEIYYKRMVEENPSNPLFLRNYAQFLHQVKSTWPFYVSVYSHQVWNSDVAGLLLFFNILS